MFRKLAPLTVALAVVLAAAGCGQETLDDPKEILTRSVQAMSEVDSVHFVLALDGRVSIPDMGGQIGLAGTHLEGSMAMDGSAASITFAVPAFLGLSGELRVVDSVGYVKTSLTGPMWMEQPVEDDDDQLPVADPQEALTELEELLDKEGVTLTKLDDVECGEDACYQLELSIAGSVFAEADEAGDAPDEVLGALEGGLTFILHVDKETLYLRLATTSFEDEEMGSVSLSLTFDGWNEPVEVEAPPADEITEDGGFTFP